jgi:hypothetical protein
MKKINLLIALSCLGAAPAMATTFIAQYVGPTAPSTPSGTPAGLYVQVLDGTISMTNGGGAQSFSAGQFGYTASVQAPPVILPRNPGLPFTLPPTFSSPKASSSASTPTMSNSVDCVVR